MKLNCTRELDTKTRFECEPFALLVHLLRRGAFLAFSLSVLHFSFKSYSHNKYIFHSNIMSLSNIPESEEITFDLNDRFGLRLRGLARGPEDGKPFLLLHGWMDSAATFEPLLDHLYGEALEQMAQIQTEESDDMKLPRMIALDFAGHGKSDQRVEHTYHYIDYARDVLAVLNLLGWDRCTLIGHSLGSSIAWVLTAAFPERVSQLVMIEGIGVRPAPPSRVVDSIRESLTYVRPSAPNTYESMEAAIQRRVQGNVVGALPREAAAALATRGVVATDDKKGFYWNYDPSLKQPSAIRLVEEHAVTICRRIERPTLVVLAHDGLFFSWLGGVSPEFVFSFVGYWLAFVLLMLVSALNMLTLKRVRKLEKIRRLLEMAVGFSNRIRAWKSTQTLSMVIKDRGGHHVHLTEPEMVSDEIVRFVSFFDVQE